MTLRYLLALVAISWLTWWSPAIAQTSQAMVVSVCGTPPVTYTAGQAFPNTQDTTGTSCTKGGAVTAISGAFQAGSIVDIGTGPSPAANTVNANLLTMEATLASILGVASGPTPCNATAAVPSAGSTGTVSVNCNGSQVLRTDGSGYTQPVIPSTASLVSGTITTAMTVTTSTQLLAAPGVGLRNYVTQITCGNLSTTVGTWIDIQDGSGGTVIYQIPAGISYQGGALTFPTPLRQPTLNTGLFAVNETTGASTKCSASGFSGA